MKRSIFPLLCTLLVTTSVVAAPGDFEKIERPLAEYLERAPEGELVQVVVIMERQLAADQKAKLFVKVDANDKSAKQKRRKVLVSALQRLAKADQDRLLGWLEEMEQQGRVSHIRPLWLVNAVGVRAREDSILELTKLPGVHSIHLDMPRPVKGAAAWGVTQIGADSVWALPSGFDGTGVTVAILDTGVDYTHPDLVGRMWINAAEDDGDGIFTAADNDGVDDDGNGFVDDVVGWNFSGTGSNDPADVQGHGTHVAGTVAGDGSGGTDTGVAPGARIMALRESNTIALSTEQECWDGMQYALDNGADVVNFSSGWLDAWAPAYALWRSAVENLMDGGVLFVTISHNDSNGTGAPNNVRTPGRVPSALTVGATDNTDAIAGFSNHGPVTWQSTAPYMDYPWPPGLLKPDVTAPGVNVDSTLFGGGYGPMDGTSMAAPHTAGLAALLLDEDPGLDPYELKFLIEETAVDLGAAGPDNVFGWGRINALAAINYTPPAGTYDLSVTPTTSVWTNTDIWVDNNDDGTPDTPAALSNNHLYARIRNLGAETVSNVEVKFYFADVGTIGIGGFDPNGDGDPDDGNFTYIGSYTVPTLGPSGSNHETAEAVVNWNIPVPTGDHWCVGIGIVAPNPPNAAEGDTSNNAGFRNFFDITTSTTGFAFKLYPPPKAPREPFQVEFVKHNIPDDAEVELVVDRALEELVMAGADGFKLVPDPRLDIKAKGLPKAYYEILAADLHDVRYVMNGQGAVLPKVRSPDGEPLAVRVIFRVPDKPEDKPKPPCDCPGEKPLRDDDRYFVINALDREGRPYGGLTIRLNKK